jgi:AcrR family transcriptional regulator
MTSSSHERLREAAKSLFAEHGYESTSTSEICRLAGTSESQLVRHFINKEGLLEAIFEHAWNQLNPGLRLATESASSPREKLNRVVEMMLAFLAKDKELRALFLFEGHRIHGDGQVILLVPSFVEFIKILDEILCDLAAAGELRSDVPPQAARAGLIGAIEGLLRDQMLSRASRLQADYTVGEVQAVSSAFISACLSRHLTGATY